jgi:predicted ATPase
VRIEKITIKRFRAFRDVTLKAIPGFCVLVGANGSGKSTLFDIFSFLKDALTLNVSKALAKRGGYHEVVTRGEPGPISIELKFRESKGKLATYYLEVSEQGGKGIVEREVLRYKRGTHGKPWHFLDFRRGQGSAIVNEEDYGKQQTQERRETQELESPDILAIKGLGQFQRFRVVSEFRRLIENWHISDFHIQEARPSQEEGIAEHLSTRGDNLALVAQFLHDHHRPIFDRVIKKMKHRVPGIASVEAQTTLDGRIVLRFQDGAFQDPFMARFVSDGTIKMFAYLVLLNDPKPCPLLAVEEPENQLYPELLGELAEEFREYAEKGGQVFVSTHSPDFLNSVNLPEIYWLKKEGGFTTVHRAQDNKQLVALAGEGDLPGALWRQGFFEGVHPRS